MSYVAWNAVQASFGFQKSRTLNRGGGSYLTPKGQVFGCPPIPDSIVAAWPFLTDDITYTRANNSKIITVMNKYPGGLGLYFTQQWSAISAARSQTTTSLAFSPSSSGNGIWSFLCPQYDGTPSGSATGWLLERGSWKFDISCNIDSGNTDSLGVTPGSNFNFGMYGFPGYAVGAAANVGDLFYSSVLPSGPSVFVVDAFLLGDPLWQIGFVIDYGAAFQPAGHFLASCTIQATKA